MTARNATGRVTPRKQAASAPPSPSPELPTSIVVDIGGLTIDEMEQVEDALDIGMQEVAAIASDPKARKAHVLKAVALVQLRRTHPHATLADAGRLQIESRGASPNARRA